MRILLLSSVLIFTFICIISCTYNISIAHTEGTATDTIDDNATNTPNISPKITVPFTPGSEVNISK